MAASENQNASTTPETADLTPPYQRDFPAHFTAHANQYRIDQYIRQVAGQFSKLQDAMQGLSGQVASDLDQAKKSAKQGIAIINIIKFGAQRILSMIDQDISTKNKKDSHKNIIPQAPRRQEYATVAGNLLDEHKDNYIKIIESIRDQLTGYETQLTKVTKANEISAATMISDLRNTLSNIQVQINNLKDDAISVLNGMKAVSTQITAELPHNVSDQRSATQEEQTKSEQKKSQLEQKRDTKKAERQQKETELKEFEAARREDFERQILQLNEHIEGLTAELDAVSNTVSLLEERQNERAEATSVPRAVSETHAAFNTLLENAVSAQHDIQSSIKELNARRPRLAKQSNRPSQEENSLSVAKHTLAEEIATLNIQILELERKQAELQKIIETAQQQEQRLSQIPGRIAKLAPALRKKYDEKYPQLRAKLAQQATNRLSVWEPTLKKYTQIEALLESENFPDMLQSDTASITDSNGEVMTKQAFLRELQDTQRDIAGEIDAIYDLQDADLQQLRTDIPEAIEGIEGKINAFDIRMNEFIEFLQTIQLTPKSSDTGADDGEGGEDAADNTIASTEPPKANEEETTTPEESTEETDTPETGTDDGEGGADDGEPEGGSDDRETQLPTAPEPVYGGRSLQTLKGFKPQLGQSIIITTQTGGIQIGHERGMRLDGKTQLTAVTTTTTEYTVDEQGEGDKKTLLIRKEGETQDSLPQYSLGKNGEGTARVTHIEVVDKDQKDVLQACAKNIRSELNGSGLTALSITYKTASGSPRFTIVFGGEDPTSVHRYPELSDTADDIWSWATMHIRTRLTEIQSEVDDPTLSIDTDQDKLPCFTYRGEIISAQIKQGLHTNIISAEDVQERMQEIDDKRERIQLATSTQKPLFHGTPVNKLINDNVQQGDTVYITVVKEGKKKETQEYVVSGRDGKKHLGADEHSQPVTKYKTGENNIIHIEVLTPQEKQKHDFITPHLTQFKRELKDQEPKNVVHLQDALKEGEDEKIQKEANLIFTSLRDILSSSYKKGSDEHTCISRLDPNSGNPTFSQGVQMAQEALTKNKKNLSGKNLLTLFFKYLDRNADWDTFMQSKNEK